MDAATLDALRCCAGGEISPAIALLRLLMAHGDAAAVRAALATPGSGDPALTGAADRVRALLDADPRAGDLVLRLLEHERGTEAAAPEEDPVERCRRAFERAVRDSAEGSVALYSLGSPALLAAATAEVVALLERLGVLGPVRHALEIGCGIGRFEAALSGRLAAITGIDIAAAMLEEARRRCAGVENVAFRRTSGRDLAGFESAAFDLVLAVDSLPYVHRAGTALLAAHFAEAARVLRAGGDFVVLNLTYRGDLARDREDAARLAAAAGLQVLRNGTRDLALWDGAAFHLKKPA